MPKVHTEELLLKLIQGYLEAKNSPKKSNPNNPTYTNFKVIYKQYYVM